MKFRSILIPTFCILLLQLILCAKKDSSMYELYSQLKEGRLKQDAPAEPPADIPSTASNSTESFNVTYIINLNDPNAQLADWLFVSSDKLKDPEQFPFVKTKSGSKERFDFAREGQAINNKYLTEARAEGAVDEKQFYFRARAGYLYFAETKSELNILGSILVKNVTNALPLVNAFNRTTVTYCFNVLDFQEYAWRICTLDEPTKMKWMCSLQDYTQSPIEFGCTNDVKAKIAVDEPVSVEKRKVTQPVIVIPIESKHCNEIWDYKEHGSNWECTCKDGERQSPIDLPSKDDAKLSPLKPIFQYEFVNAKSDQSTMDGLLIQGEYIKIRYDRNSIRIPHPNLGKIVTEDGAVFQAEEIIFHTPAEHTINGETFDMEMQIVHYGKTKGDIAKQTILSFVFKKKPGVYNKFLDKLDFFNLPNPIDVYRDITNDLFIPTVFYNSDDEDYNFLKPFSFFSYEGSLTSPPCTERTIHYVVADPIPISNTVIHLFREALRMPDSTDDKGNIYISDDVYNNREIQPRNDRKVLIYDHIKYNCPEYKPAPKKVEPAGHYEKHDSIATEYIFVPSVQPSGIPNSFVVTEDEAKGIIRNKK